MNRPNINLSRYAKWSLISSLVGAFAGLSSSIFLILLNWATQVRIANLDLIWLLPIAGFCVGLLYHLYGKDVSAGSNLILDEIHDPKKVVPLRMAPFILFGTVVSHLFGASVGREGTAVQMGASLGDQITRFLKITQGERKILLVAGAGAGFGAAIGTPFAGAIFGMEIISVGNLRLYAWFECLVASFVGFYVSRLCHAPHSHFSLNEATPLGVQVLFYVLIFGASLGLISRLFIRLTHVIEQMFKQISYPPLRPLLGGSILVFLYWIEGTYRFAGLGIDQIQKSIQEPSALNLPFLKTLFTSLSIGSGFKGGEFVPLVFIGATFGSFVSTFIPISSGTLAAIGFAALFAGASNAPIACSIMAVEIFGFKIAPYAVVGCFASFYFSGHSGIYKSQRIHRKKHVSILNLLSWLAQLPKYLLNERSQSDE